MVKVSRRIYEYGQFRFEPVGEFKTYAAAIKAFNGIQDWFDKKVHRFTSNGETYIMTK